MTRFHAKIRDERGMTLVMVATGMVAFLSATMLAVDVGMMMVARTEAQSSADAGALAGAIALGYDDPNDYSATGPAKTNAIAASMNSENGVMNANVSVFPEDVTFPTPTQVRVRVQRSSMRGNPLQTFFAPMFGVDTVNIGAEATAEVSPANAMTCVKPFAIPDKWIEKQTPPWDPTDTFDLYDNKGNLLADPDIYIPRGQPGYTGYSPLPPPYGDRGALVTLKAGQGGQITPSFYFPYAMGGITGADEYEWNVGNCNQLIMGYDALIVAEPGNMSGPTKSGLQTLVDRDPYAHWDTSKNEVVSNYHPSPRVVALPVFDPVFYETGKQNGRNADVKLVNYMGFFIEEMSGNDVKGYVTPIGGLLTGNGPAPTGGSFPIAIVLVK